MLGEGKVIKMLKTLKSDDFSETGLLIASADTLQIQTKPYLLSKTIVVSFLGKKVKNGPPNPTLRQTKKPKNQPPQKRRKTKQNKISTL